ncbi:hybrid sensor histidine kinase/response regulator [Rheinheimera riviphila]|uniref:Chemotaxis protein CheA n=1 Tax=Rheinheimera riviphila TaxID=1834037 RepID=A0A437R1C6_9GAMM|nr:response regulator [Rheinheimera riviphila]RVU40576.1 hybrid sensor histidine kinase/response regulator [Rheinheimera riviphila]
MTEDQLQNASLLELFLLEAQSQTQALDLGLIQLLQQPEDKQQLEACMRAAHSLKGAARLVGVHQAVDLAHVMEELLVEAMRGQRQLLPLHIQLLMQASAMLLAIANGQPVPELAELVAAIARQYAVGQPLLSTAATASTASKAPAAEMASPPQPQPASAALPPTPVAAPPLPHSDKESTEHRNHTLRVNAERLDLLLDLASRALVVSKNSQKFSTDLIRVKKTQLHGRKLLESLREMLMEYQLPDHVFHNLTELTKVLQTTQNQIQHSIQQYEHMSWDAMLLNQQMYDTALSCRMRPFADLLTGKARLVYELATQLDKQVQFLVEGHHTAVDRNILERLEAPLVHLLRNAVDHGIESTAQRLQAGKPAPATLQLTARHAAGFLQIELSDDGNGIDLENIKNRILAKQLSTAEAVRTMDEQELLAFLFLPDFSLARQVSALSGRGVGLDVVQHEITQLGGQIALKNRPGQGCTFQLKLPVTVSVVRCVIFEVGTEMYAMPLHRIEQMLRLPKEQLVIVEGRPHFWWNGDAISILLLSQLLGLKEGQPDPLGMGVMLFQDRDQKIALSIERFIGEQSLVVLPMDSRLGHLSAVAAGAILSDGTPVLILDTDDLLTTAHTLLKQGQIGHLTDHSSAVAVKKVLVVDDSLTVRELERKLLTGKGYQVTVAVDGLEGWSMLRSGAFDLLVTDIDMPRMNGIELVKLVRADARLYNLPVIIVSYKDRAEDQQLGLDAGADYYLAKSSFHDESLYEAVHRLIGASGL